MASKKYSFKKLFRLFLVALVVILLWRGVDALLDALLFPSNEILSGIASIIIAFCIFYFANLRLSELE